MTHSRLKPRRPCTAHDSTCSHLVSVARRSEWESGAQGVYVVRTIVETRCNLLIVLDSHNLNDGNQRVFTLSASRSNLGTGGVAAACVHNGCRNPVDGEVANRNVPYLTPHQPHIYVAGQDDLFTCSILYSTLLGYALRRGSLW